MTKCDNCNKDNAGKHLCDDCYNNIFKSLYCDGHCGRKCDPSQRTGSNIIALPWWWYCETCRKRRENPALPPDEKRPMEADEIDKLKEKIKKYEEEQKKLLEEQKKLIDEQNKLKEETKNLSNENEIMKRMTETINPIYHDLRHKLENFYDIIIDVDSLRHMIKGWKVKFTPEGKKNYDIMKDEAVLIIGVVGNRNRGKSFVLSKLSNVNLPEGTSIKTEGISIKYPRMNENKKAKYILMDSAGFENALLETDEFTNDSNIPKDDAQKMLKVIARDKTLTEFFIQNFIIQKSNILIVVIGILNYPEQKLLNRLKIENEAKFKHGIPPPLFVVHNLQTFSLIKQVKDYIKETLLKSATFKLREMKSVDRDDQEVNEQMNDIYYIEEFREEQDKQKIVYHLILAMHGTEAGDYYNKFTYNFLSKQFNSFPIHNKFPIVEDVKEECMRNSEKIMTNPINSIEEFEKSETEIKLICKDKEEEQKRLEFKKCLVDELGFSSFYGANFNPKYSYFKTTIEKKKFLCVQVELPGDYENVKCRGKMSDQRWLITVKGSKKINNKIDKENLNSYYPGREEGDFSLLIKLDPQEFSLKEKTPNKDLNTTDKGLYCYYFPLVEDDESDSD
jgi:hypothetical protein